MSEWLAVVLAGAIGGSMSTLLPAGTEFPMPEVMQAFFDRHPVWSLIAHFFRNTTFGGVASFVVWGLANPSLEFGDSTITAGGVAAAIVVGGGGVSAINKLFQQSTTLDKRDEAMEATAEMIRIDEQGDVDGED